MGHTLLLEVPDNVYETLVETAERKGQPREVLAVEWLTAAIRYLASDPLEKFVGAFSSNGSDWADDHDRHLGKSVLETMRDAESEERADA